MKAFAGSWRLFRLALRLDRIRLPIWILVNTGLVFLTLPQLISAYGTPEQTMAYAAATAPSAVTRLLGGALTGPSIGEIAIVETYVLILLLTVLMNIFLVVRHTRTNEETNRSELMESMEVGRQAGLTAALFLALLTNVITSSLIFVAFRTNDFPLAGSVTYSLSIGLIGMLFASIAAITAQLHQNARTASGTAGLIFGIAFLVRGVGDALGSLTSDGLGVNTSWLSWFSPAAWTTNMRPFAGEKWWVFGLFGIAIFATISAAYILLSRRDVGAGIIEPKPGRASAKPWLLTQFGLVTRLNRASFLAWLSSFMVFGAAIGAVAQEFEELIAGNEEMQKMLASLGSSTDISNLLFGVTFTLAGIGITGYALQLMARMRSEESSGRLELLLSSSKSRVGWLYTHSAFAGGTAIVILVGTGFAAGLAYGLIEGDVLYHVLNLSSSILVQLPAILILMGLSLVIFSLFPRYFTALTWGTLSICLLIFQVGAILNLPQWALNFSPFTHTPSAPAESINFAPLYIQSAVAAALFFCGFVLFKRRDISSE